MILHNASLRRLKRVRGKIAANISIPRLSVFRSNRHIWAQIIDDNTGRSLVTANSKSLTDKGTKTQHASQVGQDIATKALKLKITSIRFDRGSYHYHGRIKALAEGARQKGLKF